MPEISYSTEIAAPVEITWAFVKDMDNWAPFVMGYQEHERVSDEDSIWTLKGDVGMLSRTVRFRVHITEWAGPSRVAFTMTGVNEPMQGQGVFRMTPGSSDAQSHLEFELQFKAGGMAGPVVNALMEPLLRPFAEGLASKIAHRVGSTETRGEERWHG